MKRAETDEAEGWDDQLHQENLDRIRADEKLDEAEEEKQLLAAWNALFHGKREYIASLGSVEERICWVFEQIWPHTGPHYLVGFILSVERHGHTH